MTRSARSKSSLSIRVLAVLAIAVVTPTIAVGALAIQRARTSLEREVVQGNLALIRALGASLDGTLQNARRALDIAAAAWADSRTGGAPAGLDDDAATRRLLRRMRRDVPLFSALTILDADGTPIAGDDLPDLAEADIGTHTFGGYIGDITFHEGEPRILVVTQARSRTGELVGTFVARLDLGFIADALGRARLGPGARLLVVDGEGVPVARSDGQVSPGGRSLRGDNPAVDGALGSATDGSVSARGMVAVYRNLSSFQSLRGVRWAIILEQPERDAYALAYETTRVTVVTGIVALACALLFGALLATRLTRPLVALTHRADAIASGDVSALDRPLDGPGEIGSLAERIEEMARRLRERQQLKDALARGDRLAAVGTMSASVAHEINNPLTTVLGYAKLLLEDKPADHPDRAGLELIADEAARMQQIVRGLLDYSRAKTDSERGAGESADVNELLRKTTALLAPSLRKQGVRVDLELATALPATSADAHDLQQVLVNLVQNAAHAMADGGTVTLTSALGPGDVAIEIGVVDTGPGVPADRRASVFDPFYTTKGAGVGTGLGLAVAKHLVTRSGGTISVGDGPGGCGAHFRVIVPIASGTAVPG